MNILKTKLNQISTQKEFLKIYKKELFVKGSFLFLVNGFYLINTLNKSCLLYPKKTTVLLQKKTYQNNNIYISNFSKYVYLMKLLKSFLFYKNKKIPVLKCRVLKCKKKKLLIGFQGFVFKINLNRFLPKKKKSFKVWRKTKRLYKFQCLSLFFQLNNKLQINLSRKIILNLLKQKNASI